jgi:LacI family transcriptional regulator
MASLINDDTDTATTKYGYYKRVEEDLRKRVARGEWKPGMLLPRRRDLAREYEIDINTLQRAILPLVADGTLLAEGKRGTIVNGVSDTPLIPQQRVQTNSASANRVRRSGVAEDFLRKATIGVVAQLETGQALAASTGTTHTRDTLRSIESTCTNHGGQVRLFNTYLAGGTGCGANDAIATLLTEGVDAIIVIDIFDNPAIGMELGSMPVPEDFPLVYISSVGNFVPYLHVFYDQRHAGYLAANHLLDRGWNDITFLAPYRANWVEDRIAGARLAVERSGRDNCRFTVVPLSRHAEQFETDELQLSNVAVSEAIANNLLKGGIIAANDSIAKHVAAQMATRGLTFGTQYALAGFDDDIESSSLGLTSVRPPLEEMGAVAVRLAGRRLAGEQVNLHVCLRSQLVARSSTSGIAPNSMI